MRIILSIAIFALVLTGISPVFAQGAVEGVVEDSSAVAVTEQQRPYYGKGMYKKKDGMKMCPMCSGMMKSMLSTEMVATTDGGAIVLNGNKLIKYDKNLNVVKEIEIKKDMEAMHQMMMKMKDCSMCKMMKDKGSDGASGSDESMDESEKQP